MKPIVLVRVWTKVSLVSILGPKNKTVTRGRPYKFALLNHPKFGLKQVFRAKSVYLKLYSSKLSETGWNGHRMDGSFSGTSFRI